MASVEISMKVDDRVMLEAVGGLGRDGIKAASRRGVLKTARLGQSELKARTRAAMYNNPGGYDPYKASNFRVPRVRSTFGELSAGTGYTAEGYIDRFRSMGTGPRYRGSGALHESRRTKGKMIHTRDKGGGYTGVLRGLGMVQGTAHDVDPLFPAIMDAEMVIEVKKRGL